MEIQYSPKTNKEAAALAKLIQALIAKGHDISGYGFFAKNPKFGNIYLWLEDCSVTPFCAPGTTRVQWCYSCGNCGDEIIGTYAECMAAVKYEQKHDKCRVCK